MNLESFIPGLAELRAVERRNRAFAFARLTSDVCGVEVLPLTPRVRLGLQLVQNAFVYNRVEPLEGDLFQFLWFLSVAYRDRALWFKTPTISRELLRRRARTMDLGESAKAIRDFMVEQLQDLPGESGGASDGNFNPGDHVHWMGAEAGFWLNIHGGFTLEAYLDTPYLVLQQLFRTWQINHPRYDRGPRGELVVDEPEFTNASDRLVKQWYRDRRENAGAILRAQTERRN